LELLISLKELISGLFSENSFVFFLFKRHAAAGPCFTVPRGRDWVLMALMVLFLIL